MAGTLLWSCGERSTPGSSRVSRLVRGVGRRGPARSVGLMRVRRHGASAKSLPTGVVAACGNGVLTQGGE